MQPGAERPHIPVLSTGPQSVFAVLKPAAGESVLDLTLGLGGHSQGFLHATGPDGALTAFDADTGNLEYAREVLKTFGKRCMLIHANFRDAGRLAQGPFDIIFADLGLSSPHLDDPARGFSFKNRSPLDMRLDRSTGKPAWQLLQRLEEKEIARLLRHYGEVERAGSLAREVALMFQERPSQQEWTTDDLKACVERVYGYKAPGALPQVFQAVRIAVNDELGALESLLASLPALLRHGGRAGIISYHSLEDRMVKRTFRDLSTPEKDPHTGAIAKEADFLLLTRKAVVPSAEEQQLNPRSRSAKFRAVLRR